MLCRQFDGTVEVAVRRIDGRVLERVRVCAGVDSPLEFPPGGTLDVSACLKQIRQDGLTGVGLRGVHDVGVGTRRGEPLVVLGDAVEVNDVQRRAVLGSYRLQTLVVPVREAADRRRVVAHWGNHGVGG